jgi:hypothetical protein
MPITKMKAEEQRIAIQTWLGWHVVPDEFYEDRIALVKGDERMATCDIPDYPNDLNAIAEAEKILDDRHKYTDDLRSMYWDYLALGAEGFPDKWECSWHVLRATAAHRCEALLRTLNLWKETPKGEA